MPEDFATGFDSLAVADLMETDVLPGSVRMRGDVLASLIIEGVECVPIVDDNHRLVGIVTARDLLTALDSGKELSDLSAPEVMIRDPVRVTPETEVATLLYVMQTNHLSLVAVVDGAGRLLGTVTRGDVLRGYLASRPEVAEPVAEMIGC